MKKQSQGKATHFGVFGSTSLPEKDVKKLRDELAETKAQWKELQVVKRIPIPKQACQRLCSHTHTYTHTIFLVHIAIAHSHTHMHTHACKWMCLSLCSLLCVWLCLCRFHCLCLTAFNFACLLSSICPADVGMPIACRCHARV
jgi:hypothetical protein